MKQRNEKLEEASAYYDQAKSETGKDGRSKGLTIAKVAKQFGVKLNALQNFRFNHIHRTSRS